MQPLSETQKAGAGRRGENHKSTIFGVLTKWKKRRDAKKRRSWALQLIAASGLFDAEWYLENNPDVADAGVDPLRHYLERGGFEGRAPSAGFSSRWYLTRYEDVANAEINPLLHYLKKGKAEGREPLPRRPSELRSGGLDLPHPDAAHVKKYIADHAGRTCKIAVYTAVVGGYDRLIVPKKLNPDIDYVVFSDQPADTYGVWQVRPIPYYHPDKTRMARYVKTHPHVLLCEYETAIWVDANVAIYTDLEEYVARVRSAEADIGCVVHPQRDCVFEEAKACKELNKDDHATIDRQIERYRAHGVEPGAGLFETNFMVFDLTKARVNEMLRLWWSEIDLHSRRDQLSIGWALRKSQADVVPVLPAEFCCRNHPDFELLSHRETRSRRPPAALADLARRADPYSAERYADVKACRLQNLRPRRADAIVCVWNALEDVKLCLDAVVTHLEANQNLIVVNDKSDHPTTAFLREFAAAHRQMTLIENAENLGYTKSANRGLAASDADFRVLLNSDTIVSAGWLAKMMDVAYSNNAIGIVGPMSNAASWQSIPDTRSTKGQTAINALPPNVTPAECDEACEQWSLGDCFPSVPLVHGFCLGIKSEVIDKIGCFDDVNFARFYGEENDYCFRARRAGFELAIATNVFVYHAKSRSIAQEIRLIHMEAAGKRFREIYGAEEVALAVKQMAEHPLLQRMRECAIPFWNTAQAPAPARVAGGLSERPAT